MQEMNALVYQLVPGLSPAVFERGIAVRSPFAEQNGCPVFAGEARSTLLRLQPAPIPFPFHGKSISTIGQTSGWTFARTRANTSALRELAVFEPFATDPRARNPLNWNWTCTDRREIRQDRSKIDLCRVLRESDMSKGRLNGAYCS